MLTPSMPRTAMSVMATEARQTPQRIALQLSHNAKHIAAIAQLIHAFAPHNVLIIGRGSSDHAGVFAKYLIETELGLPVSAAAPSVSTLYGKTLKLNHTLVICISQSGRSPDILHQVKQAKTSGALCLALVNDVNSPLAELADHVIALHAGEEKAVAATKSYLCTLSAITQLVATLSQSAPLLASLQDLPEHLSQVCEEPAQLTLAALQSIKHCVVLGRGFGYAISREIALKLKEVCGIHAESFSSAEFLHGPVTLVASKLMIINIAINDESNETHNAQIKDIEARGAMPVTLTVNNTHGALHKRLLPFLVMLRFYLDVEDLAKQMGYNPDEPVGLKKVTQTL